MTSEPTHSHVKAFWNTEACGTHFVNTANAETEFFEKFREFRYRTEWHIPLMVPFAEAKGKKVLEIGIGNGADAVMFALNGADYTGVDLTDAARDATRRHFAAMGLHGTVLEGNAEHLSLPDESFDWVYSYGVLHHTPNTQLAIDEVYRVLRPGGRAIIMLYHKHSFNYYVRIAAYMRLRVLIKILLRAGQWSRDRAAVSDSLLGVRGNQDKQIWTVHYHNFLRDGWRYLLVKNFVHHCTDGPECPVAYAFSGREAMKCFAKFRSVRTAVAHFPLRKYSQLIPHGLERFLAKRMGWYLFVYAEK